MLKLPLLGSFGASIKGGVSKKASGAASKKLTAARIIKTTVCALAFLGVMAAFSYLGRELAGNYLLLILPQAGLTVSWLLRLGIFVVCLAVTINIMAVLVRPVWLVVITYFLAAVMYLLIIGADKVILIVAAVFFAGLLIRLISVVKQLDNQVNFSTHPLADKNFFFFSLLAMLVAASFWLGYSQDMARRAFVITPEIKSMIIDLSVGQTKNVIKKQHLPPAQEKAALAAARQKIQEMIESLEKSIKPFAQFIPLILAAVLLSLLTTIFLLLGIISFLILKILFILMRLTRFTNFTIETRETKRLTL